MIFIYGVFNLFCIQFFDVEDVLGGEPKLIPFNLQLVASLLTTAVERITCLLISFVFFFKHPLRFHVYISQMRGIESNRELTRGKDNTAKQKESTPSRIEY